MKIPIHEVFELSYNDHRSVYHSAEFTINSRNSTVRDFWKSEKDKQLAITTNTIWEAQIYTKVSNKPPYGDYYFLYSATLPGILELLASKDCTEFPTKHINVLQTNFVSLYLSHNTWKHNCIDNLLEEEIEDDWVNPEEREKAIASGEAWKIQWYPNSPVGFYQLYANSLDVLLTGFKQFED